MEIAWPFLVYALLFRLAVIGAGTLSVYFGYRLFFTAARARSLDRGSSLEAGLSHWRITLKNTAPGTFFAAFGVMVIASMCISGNPELTLSSLNKADVLLNGSAGPVPKGTVLRLRGESPESVRASFLAGKELEERHDLPGAVNAYTQAIAPAAEPMNALAWLYARQNRFEAAESLSRLAVQLFPDNPNYLDTLAEIRFGRGDPADACELMKKVVELHPSEASRNKLQHFEAALHKR